jgi:hypothetical protein
MKKLVLGAASAILFSAGLAGLSAQGGPPAQTAPPPDPRVGLKAGVRDAGTAAKNMVLVSSMP